MYNIIPLILILVALSIIIVIVVGKFPMLASLDMANIPAEKEAKVKQQIISNRLKRNFIKYFSKFINLLRPLGYTIANLGKLFYKKLIELRGGYTKPEKLQQIGDIKKEVGVLLLEAEDLKRKNDLVEAEKKCIEAISLDSKNIKIFKLLGEIYFLKKEYQEAKQTLEHVLKLKEDDLEVYDGSARVSKESGNLNGNRDEYLLSLNINNQHSQTYLDLALVYEAMDNINEAIIAMDKALTMEPNNPRYLDTMIEFSIIKKDKTRALATLKKFSEVNPENQKLPILREQVDKL